MPPAKPVDPQRREGAGAARREDDRRARRRAPCPPPRASEDDDRRAGEQGGREEQRPPGAAAPGRPGPASAAAIARAIRTAVITVPPGWKRKSPEGQTPSTCRTLSGPRQVASSAVGDQRFGGRRDDAGGERGQATRTTSRPAKIAARQGGGAGAEATPGEHDEGEQQRPEPDEAAGLSIAEQRRGGDRRRDDVAPGARPPHCAGAVARRRGAIRAPPATSLTPAPDGVAVEQGGLGGDEGDAGAQRARRTSRRMSAERQREHRRDVAEVGLDQTQARSPPISCVPTPSGRKAPTG